MRSKRPVPHTKFSESYSSHKSGCPILRLFLAKGGIPRSSTFGSGVESLRHGETCPLPAMRAGGAPQFFGILFFPQICVPHPSLVSGEGWDTTKLDRRIGCRILSSWRNLSVTSNAGGWRTQVSWNLILPTKVGAPSFRVFCGRVGYHEARPSDRV